MKIRITDVRRSDFRSYSRPNFLYLQEEVNTPNVTKKRRCYPTKATTTLKCKKLYLITLNLNTWMKILTKQQYDVKIMSRPLKNLKVSESIDQRHYNELHYTVPQMGILKVLKIFVSFHEKGWLHNCRYFRPLLYVVDCFLLVRHLYHV